MFSIKRMWPVLVPVLLLSLLIACQSDSTATPVPTATPAPAPTATPTPVPEPTATPTPDPAAGALVIESIVFEDEDIVITMGPEAGGGFEAGAVARSKEGDGWAIWLDPGDKVFVREINQSSDAVDRHQFAMPDLAVGFPLHEIDAGGPVTNWKFTFYDEGIYAIKDAHNHGRAFFAVGDVDLTAYTPVTYILDELRVRDDVWELRIGETAYWGYDIEQRVRTDEVGDIRVFLNAGDKIVLPDGLTGSSGNAATYNVTIDEIGLDVEVPPGEDVSPGIELEFPEPGVFRLYDSSDPEYTKGNFFIIVATPPTGQPATFTLDELRVRDDVWELRIGATAYWGYEVEQRVRTDEVGDIRVALNAGDSIVLPDGLTGSSGNAATYNVTIDEIGLDVAVPPGEDVSPGIELEFPEPGVFRLYDSSDPEYTKGNFFIIVQ